MPIRIKDGISHVVKANLKKQTGLTNIDVIKAGKKEVEIWERFVQKPFINKDTNRPDQGWDWISLNRWFKPVSKALKQKPELYCICMEKEQRFVPLGMIFLANKYPALHDKSETSTFIWYLATAPREFLEKVLSSEEVPSVGKLTIDIGVTASFQNKNQGLLGLHADPKGGENLLDFYKYCNLDSLKPSAKLPRGRKFKGNDGRYFFFDKTSALSFSQSLDYLR